MILWRFCRRPALRSKFAIVTTVLLAALVVGLVWKMRATAPEFRVHGYRYIFDTKMSGIFSVTVRPIALPMGQVRADSSGTVVSLYSQQYPPISVNRVGMHGSEISATAPCALVCSMFLILPASWIAPRFRAAAGRMRRRKHGECIHCGYDLRFSIVRCPECGEIRELTHRKILSLT
jgi:hypothetical protein